MTVNLIITNNRSSILSYNPGPKNSAQLRMHQMFLSASPEVVHALGLWLKRRQCKRSGAIIDDFIRANRHMIPGRDTAKTIACRAQGCHHDLQRMYDEVNAKYFDGTVQVPITWGKFPTKRNRHSIRFGSYSPEDRLIRVHPYLDQDFVPEFFVRYIVFHEMLHAHLGIEVQPSGRRIIHSKKFNEMERAYPDFERANDWHNSPTNLRKLLRAKPRRVA